MAGLVPAIHVLGRSQKKDVDARHKAGRDELRNTAPQTQLSSPGLTGRSSIPEAVVIDPEGRGVLDPRFPRG
jgi:hypothetical protein